jgi:uncharacterized membrane protein YfcA
VRSLIVLSFVGFLAQLVDGALGMAYGVTSTSLLLVAGLAPAAASASVHLAEIGTTVASGAAHWRFGNVDWRVVVRIGVPGAVGAFVGATVLSGLATTAALPWTSTILLGLGVYLLIRFAVTRSFPVRPGQLRRRFLAPLGLTAGFIDATGGGGWGPVATPALLTSGRIEPRKVIGSVDTSEFLVAAAASLGFLIGLGRSGFVGWTVIALLIGGLLAAPVAAWLVRIVPARALGTAVGGLIVVTNSRNLLTAFEVAPDTRVVVYAVLVIIWAAGLTLSVRRVLADRALAREAAQLAPAEGPGLVSAEAEDPVPA